MLDDQQRGAALQQFAERAEELGDVIEMQTGGRLVKNIENAFVVGAAEMRGKLQALGFAAGERRRGLPEAQVAEANFIQDTEFGNNLGNIDEKRQRFAHRQLQDFVNIFPVIADFQNTAFEAGAAAFFADEFDVGEKLHLDRDGAVALASFAAASRHVERKMAGSVTAAFCIGRVGKNFANRVKGFEVGRGIRTRRAADRRLIDNDDFSDNRIAFQPVAEFLDAATDALRRERFVEHIMNERGLAGAADAGDHRKRSERNHQIQILEIVHVGTVEAEEFAGGFVAYVGNGDAQFAAEVATGERSMLLEHR